jgi:hypothetical protein
MEFRAILATRRPLLESLVPEWLDDRAEALFRDADLGPATFDLTLKWARPTPWLYDRFRHDMFASATRNAEHALSHLLIATLHEIAGYGINEVLKQLRTNQAVLRDAVEEVPSLVQSAEPGSPELVVAVRFWRALLDANRHVVPVSVLDAAGRWVFVTGLPHADWLQLTARTVQLTGGAITYPIEVANRCYAIPPDGTVLTLLTAMVDHGEPWERSYVQGKALAVLKRAANQQAASEFALLRTRLIELGRHEAIPIVQEPWTTE